MSRLLLASALVELGAGLAFMLVPSPVVALILGAPLDSAAAVLVARVAGAALVALGVACWSSRDSGAARPVVLAMLVYNAAVAVLLVTAFVGAHLGGVALWPTVLVHAGMAAWCVAGLRGSS